MAELSAGDAKLIHYLNEAYSLEKRLETALQAHIAMTVKATYKKRLKEHLSETKRHGREVKQRIKQLGGTAETMSAAGPEPIAEAAQAVLSGTQKAVAFTQGPLHALRGTGEQEKQLKNAKAEYTGESEEIAPTPRSRRSPKRSPTRILNAGSHYSSRGGAYAGLLGEGDTAADEGSGQGGDPRLPSAQPLLAQNHQPARTGRAQTMNEQQQDATTTSSTTPHQTPRADAD
jgi:ferritin-like metal-binding protein YciE